MYSLQRNIAVVKLTILYHETKKDVFPQEEMELDSCEIEPVGKHLIPGVEMVALSKHYGGKHNPYALRNLSLKLYQG